MIIAKYTVEVKGGTNRQILLVYTGTETLDAVDIIEVTNAFNEHLSQWANKPLTASRASFHLEVHIQSTLAHVQSVPHPCVADLEVTLS